MGLSDGGRVMARTEPEPIYRIDIVPVEVNFENLPAMQELQECLRRLDAARENAGQPGSHGLRIPPVSGQAPCFGTERPREAAADQTTGDDPVGQQYNNAGGLAAETETFGAGAPLADRHTRQQQNDLAEDQNEKV